MASQGRPRLEPEFYTVRTACERAGIIGTTNMRAIFKSGFVQARRKGKALVITRNEMQKILNTIDTNYPLLQTIFKEN